MSNSLTAIAAKFTATQTAAARKKYLIFLWEGTGDLPEQATEALEVMKTLGLSDADVERDQQIVWTMQRLRPEAELYGSLVNAENAAREARDGWGRQYQLELKKLNSRFKELTLAYNSAHDKSFRSSRAAHHLNQLRSEHPELKCPTEGEDETQKDVATPIAPPPVEIMDGLPHAGPFEHERPTRELLRPQNNLQHMQRPY